MTEALNDLKRETICRVSSAMRRGDAVEALLGLQYLSWIEEAECVVTRFAPELKLWMVIADPDEPVRDPPPLGALGHGTTDGTFKSRD